MMNIGGSKSNEDNEDDPWKYKADLETQLEFEYYFFYYFCADRPDRMTLELVSQIPPSKKTINTLWTKIQNKNSLETYQHMSLIATAIIQARPDLAIYMCKRIVEDVEDLIQLQFCKDPLKLKIYCNLCWNYMSLIDENQQLAMRAYFKNDENKMFTDLIGKLQKNLEYNTDPSELLTIQDYCGQLLLQQTENPENFYKGNDLLLEAIVGHRIRNDKTKELVPIIRNLGLLASLRADDIGNSNTNGDEIYRICLEMIQVVRERMEDWVRFLDLETKLKHSKILSPHLTPLFYLFHYDGKMYPCSWYRGSTMPTLPVHSGLIPKYTLTHICEDDPRLCPYHCSFCFRLSDKKLAGCGKCSSVFYCDRECQKKHWKYHKTRCNQKFKYDQYTDPQIANFIVKSLFIPAAHHDDDE